MSQLKCTYCFGSFALHEQAVTYTQPHFQVLGGVRKNSGMVSVAVVHQACQLSFTQREALRDESDDTMFDNRYVVDESYALLPFKFNFCPD